MSPHSSLAALVALSAGGLVTAFAPLAADAGLLRARLAKAAVDGDAAPPAPAFSLDRRGALGALAVAAVAAVSAPGPVAALGSDKFANLMAAYGVTDYKPAPDGFSSQAEFYGKAISNVDPLLVTYNAPNGWLTVKPNIDNNGEDGTVSVGDYAKGDSVALFVSEKPLPAGASLADRQTLDDLVYAAVTVKGGGTQVQNYKLGKVGA